MLQSIASRIAPDGVRQSIAVTPSLEVLVEWFDQETRTWRELTCSPPLKSQRHAQRQVKRVISIWQRSSSVEYNPFVSHETSPYR